MRVVLDSNVIVAAYATHGLCHSLFELCLVSHTLIISRDILAELSETLQRKIHLPLKVVEAIIAFLKKNAVLENPAPLASSICRDPDDLKVLGLAVGGHADCLVSGDKDLLVIGQIHGIPILTPRQFYARLQTNPD